MRKNFFYGIAVLTIAAVAAWNMNLSSKSSNLSGVSLANVEALATGDVNNGQRYVCYNKISGQQGAVMEDKAYCGDCTSRPCSQWSNEGECRK